MKERDFARSSSSLYSTVVSKPVPCNFVAFEHLLSEFLVASIFHCVDFESVRVGVNVVILGEEVANRIEDCNHKEAEIDDHLLVWNFTS